ncbi:lysophospholipid acyltransferase family protein [Cetobacterium sp. 8H]|uniref:lysophospholipid acyltransferase family protein n=2 Tax=unclassified Cetobacterium TaxID=2630983 RepID=UPI00163BE89A|nr:lysophospholipid acyltransferase family protein [Cetobacterium sp. 8H]MBC2851509.1 lysophospholipid acyltransferase family protein [Cetobacterium sp. 8H]
MENKKYKRYGLILYYLLKIISKTMRVEIIKSPLVKDNEGYVCGFWHNKLVGASIGLANISENKAVLASPSKDGELISVPLEKMGFTIVRGSSGKDSIKSVLKLIKLVKDGYSAGTPLDGPKGPIYQVKPGMIYLAQKSEKAILPVGVAFSDKWTFEKAWDKFQMPKPFSKMVCIIGDPIFIPEDAKKEDYLDIIRDELLELDKEAEIKLGKK